MKRTYQIALVILTFLMVNAISASIDIPANNPLIKYFGRWDFTDPLAPIQSWPGVYIMAKFQGTSIGIKTNDNYNYYNVYIDGELKSVFRGNKSGVNSYTLISGLTDGEHILLLTKRNESWASYSFNGFILEDGKQLLQLPDKPVRKIEFIGDSYTSAQGNLYTKEDKPAEDAPLTNIYEGFGPIVARHYEAQYHMTSRSGFGMAVDYTGSAIGTLPFIFNRTLSVSQLPEWNFSNWMPNVVVIGLGLNDYNGFGGYTNGTVPQEKKDLYKNSYKNFVSLLRDYYPGVKVLAVAPHVEWLQKTIKEIVDEENSAGRMDLFYTFYPYYAGGYVYSGHPNLETHKKIANVIIEAIDKMNPWEPYKDNTPPTITSVPSSPFTVYDKKYLLKVQTDTYAYVRYSKDDKPFDSMENEFSSTGKHEHTTTIQCKHGETVTYYIRAKDLFGNAMAQSAAISFNTDTTKILIGWNGIGFNDSDWKKGPASFGNGINSNVTTPIENVSTVYFRKKFSIIDATKVTGLGALIKGGDGTVVYLNGKEIERINMASNVPIVYNSTATDKVVLNKMVVINSKNGIDVLRSGENLIAVEVHSKDASAVNVVFDSQLIDNNNTIIYKLGSEWNYFDKGFMPPNQLINKPTDIADEKYLPTEFILYQNYPNPFNPSTAIRFQISAFSYITLKVYDVLGKEVATLVNEFKQPGVYNSTFSTLRSSLTSGVYFYKLTTGNFTTVKKMIILK